MDNFFEKAIKYLLDKLSVKTLNLKINPLACWIKLNAKNL